MVRRLFSIMLMVSGLWMAGNYIWKNFAHVMPQPVTLEAWLPPNAEVRPENQVTPSTYRDGKTIQTFKVGVSFEEFQKLAQASPHRPLVAFFINGNRDVEYNYWLGRGDGAFYGAQGILWQPKWGSIPFETQWNRVSDSQWIAVPKWDGITAWILALVGAFIAVCGYCVWPPRKVKYIQVAVDNGPVPRRAIGPR